MKYRSVGKTGIQVSEVGIGTWEMSGDVWGPKDDETSRDAILVGLEAGANFIDTAAGYGAGHVEDLIGSLLEKNAINRDDVVLSTKVKPQNGVFAPAAEVAIHDAYPASWIRSQVEESLQRLQTDYIDLLFIHTWSKAWDAESDWSECLESLKREGIVRAVGISLPDEGASDANTHIEAGRVDVVQVVYSAFQQEPEYTLLPLAATHEVGVIARSPFSSGAMVQDWTPNMEFEAGDWRASWPLSVKPGWLEDQANMGSLIKEVFARHGISVSLGGLAYVLAQTAVAAVIPGSANPDHVVANVCAGGSGPLPEALSTELKQLWLDRKLHGTYNGSI